MLGEKKEWPTVGEFGKRHMWFHGGTPNTYGAITAKTLNLFIRNRIMY